MRNANRLFAQGVVAMANGSVFFPDQLESGTLGGNVNWGTTGIPAADGKEGVTLGVQDYFYAFNNEGNQEAVQKFHAKALALGGTDEGAPGERMPGFYAGYFRDLDGNKFCAFKMGG